MLLSVKNKLNIRDRYNRVKKKEKKPIKNCTPSKVCLKDGVTDFANLISSGSPLHSFGLSKNNLGQFYFLAAPQEQI